VKQQQAAQQAAYNKATEDANLRAIQQYFPEALDESQTAEMTAFLKEVGMTGSDLLAYPDSRMIGILAHAYRGRGLQKASRKAVSQRKAPGIAYRRATRTAKTQAATASRQQRNDDQVGQRLRRMATEHGGIEEQIVAGEALLAAETAA